MQAIRRRLATTAVAALLALFCGCPPATATEQTPGEPMLMGTEDTGVPGLEEGGVPESTGYISQDPTSYAAQEAQVTEPAYAQTQTPEADVRLTDADDIVSYSVTCEYAINKHGNLIMDHSFDKLLEQGFEEGDVLTVTINDISGELPLCITFSEVPIGEACIYRGASDSGNWAIFAINGGSFVEQLGMATYTTTDDGDGSWVVNEGFGDTLDFVFTLKERGGNADARDIASLTYTDLREDYPHLTDDQFANFREVTAGDISGGVLYRCASPVDPRHNRNTYADAAIRRAGVTHVIDLADTEEALAAFEGYSQSYFSQVSHITIDMGMNLMATPKLIGAIRYILDNPDGVFAVHCLEGKDRTGILVALLECFEGATLDEVISDYMTTYYNYYGVEPGTDLYEKIYKRMIQRQLELIFDCDDLTTISLQEAARKTLISFGLTEEEADALHGILTRTTAVTPTPQPAPAPQPQPCPSPKPYVNPYNTWPVAPQVIPCNPLPVAQMPVPTPQPTSHVIPSSPLPVVPRPRVIWPDFTWYQIHGYGTRAGNASRMAGSLWQTTCPFGTATTHAGNTPWQTGANARLSHPGPTRTNDTWSWYGRVQSAQATTTGPFHSPLHGTR